MRGILIGLFVLAILIFTVYFLQLVPNRPIPDWLITPQIVRGSSIKHKDSIYTLNFDQQKAVLGFLNESHKKTSLLKTHTKNKYKNSNSYNSIKQLVFYLFDDTEIVLIPEENNMIKTLSVLKRGEVFSIKIENSVGFNQLMQTTYDQ